MSITLDIPDALVSELTMEAGQAGLPLGDYVARLLAAGRAGGPVPRTGADLVAYWQSQGVVGCRPDIRDSQAHARGVRRQAERRG
jgi:hypothetical protein